MTEPQPKRSSLRPVEGGASESDRIRAAQAGDAAAFEALIRAHADAVFGFLVRWMRDRDGADDVFQEATLRAFKSLHRVRPDAPFKPWFFRIAINRGKTHLARAQRQPTFAPEVGTALRANRSDAHDRLEAASTLTRALERVSASDRQVLLLRFAEELSMADLATALGVPQVVVKMRVSRARKRFRAVVAQLEEEAP